MDTQSRAHPIAPATYPGAWLLAALAMTISGCADATGDGATAGGAATRGPDTTDTPAQTETGDPAMGQSGSEIGGGADTVPCPCGHGAQAGHVLRVRLTSEDGVRVTLELLEVLWGELALQPGAVLDASWDRRLPCYAGCAELAVGDEALAFYSVDRAAPPPCEARETCLAECDANNPDLRTQVWEPECECRDGCGEPLVEVIDGRDCAEECGELSDLDCPPAVEEDPARGSVRLTRWSDPVVFARGPRGEHSVATADLDQLWGVPPGPEIGECTERFGDWSQVLEYAP